MIRSIVVALIVCATMAHASPLFRVIGVRGAPVVKRGSSKTKLHAGSTLNGGDVVVIGTGDYVGLVHESGRGLELSKAGSFEVSALAASLPKGSSSIASRVSQYMLAQMEQSNAPVQLDDSHRGDMGTTGSVERLSGSKPQIHTGSQLDAFISKLDGGSSASSIRAVMPRSTSIVDSVVRFRWTGGTGPYTFVLTNATGKSVLERETKDDSIAINLASLRLESETNYYWRVRRAGESSGGSQEQMLYLLSPATSAPVLDTAAQLTRELGGAKTAVSQLILASYYEENALLTRAADAYEKAIALSDGAKDYQEAYHKFLTRIGAGQ